MVLLLRLVSVSGLCERDVSMLIKTLAGPNAKGSDGKYGVNYTERVI